MQKEAVLSYVKSKQTSPSRSVAGRGSQPDLQTPSSRNNGLTNGRAASTTSIPQPSPNGRDVGSKPPTLGKLKMASLDHSTNGHRGQYTARRDVEKSATADAHISQLRLEIESRLRITLPEDISIALADGVILCHIANHVKPRAVPSIHVPSPSVPKLTTAKCRRNVENFLLACRKIGVREENLFDWTHDMQPNPDLEAIEVTLRALLSAASTTASDNKKQQSAKAAAADHVEDHQAYDDDDDDDEAVVMVPNYPDLVPRPNPATLLLKEATATTQERPLKASDPAITTPTIQTPTTTTAGPLSETMFLLALLFGTCFLLYIFPAGS